MQKYLRAIVFSNLLVLYSQITRRSVNVTRQCPCQCQCVTRLDVQRIEFQYRLFPQNRNHRKKCRLSFRGLGGRDSFKKNIEGLKSRDTAYFLPLSRKTKQFLSRKVIFLSIGVFAIEYNSGILIKSICSHLQYSIVFSIDTYFFQEDNGNNNITGPVSRERWRSTKNIYWSTVEYLHCSVQRYISCIAY